MEAAETVSLDRLLSHGGMLRVVKITDLYEGVPVTALDYPGTLDSPDSPIVILPDSRSNSPCKTEGGSHPLLAPSFLGLGLAKPAYRIRQLLVSAATAHERRKRPAS